MIFEHRRSLKKAVLLDIGFWLCAIFLLLLSATWLTFIQREPSNIFAGKLMFAGIGLASTLVLWKTIRICQGSGEWLVQLSPQELSWQAPENSGFKSFRVSVSEIARVVCELSSSSESSHRIYIETVQGNQYFLEPSISGIHIEKLLVAMGQLGVRCEIRHVL